MQRQSYDAWRRDLETETTARENAGTRERRGEFRNCLNEVERGRTAEGRGAEMDTARSDQTSNAMSCLRSRCRWREASGRDGRFRGRICRAVQAIQWAMVRCGECRCLGRDSEENCAGLGGHRAVVRAVAAATGRQCGIRIGRESERKGAQSEKECEQDGEGTPHLLDMVQELRIEPRFGRRQGLQVSSMHLDFPTPGRRV